MSKKPREAVSIAQWFPLVCGEILVRNLLREAEKKYRTYMFALSSRVRRASGNAFVLQAISRERALLVIQESSREFFLSHKSFSMYKRSMSCYDVVNEALLGP